MDYTDFIPLVASAALNYDAQRRALNSQKGAIAAMQARQLQAQDQAAQVAAAQAAQFAPAQRQAAQAQIQQQLTGQLNQQVTPQPVTAQGVQVGQTLPEGQGGTEYLAAQAREQAKTMQSLRGLAAVMGRIGSTSQLRQDEAVGIGDAAGQIGRIGNNADNLAQIDQIRVDAAGQPNLGEQIASEALRGYGGYNIAKKALQPKTSPVLFPEYGAASGPTGAWV